MSVTGRLADILRELSANRAAIDESGPSALVDELLGARHRFIAGAGRSGVAIRGFANRLHHLGLSVSVVGEMTSPHTGPGDLLVLGSGSGATESLVSLARRASAAGTRIGLVTTNPASPIGMLADAVVTLPGTSPKVDRPGGERSIQPMGSAFEQLSFLLYDAIVLELMDRLGETSESMFARHADLE
ncbi:3-hexulose-6-phosphate isomerase [Propionicimonas sp. T2.31MG-18]|uniref:6-phospho-3-hexuloisomerase n=1 Tax=Propionicimonas sp. T2.31MG-18 TaxID=3157620 RepID=UPI0035E6D63F